MSDLISRDVVTARINEETLFQLHNFKDGEARGLIDAKEIVQNAPTVDAVEVDTLKAWLYEIAMNNTGNYLCDACGVIISRLDGLRTFARERKEASK